MAKPSSRAPTAGHTLNKLREQTEKIRFFTLIESAAARLLIEDKVVPGTHMKHNMERSLSSAEPEL